jgi:hypothetical protein
VSFYRIVYPARIIRIALGLDESDLTQDAKVMRDEAEREIKSLGDLTVALHTFH